MSGIRDPHPILEMRDLHRHFRSNGRVLAALDGVDVTLGRGRTLGVVGESGSGKSTLGRIAVGLDHPTSGTLLHEGIDLGSLGRAGRKAQARRYQMIFQDPYSSLNPRLTIGRQIGESFHAGGERDWDAIHAKVGDLLERVELGRAHIGQYPHEFSGGQRQRIAIARALAAGPSLVVADEAVSALDVTIREQIIRLMEGLKAEVSYLFISHDMAVVARMSDSIIVMYRGKIVEFGTTAEIIHDAQHPYTRSLLDSVPRIGRRRAGTPAPGWQPSENGPGRLTMLSETHGILL